MTTVHDPEEVVEVEVVEETPRRRVRRTRKPAWHKTLIRGEKMKHHAYSKWFYILTGLANILGLLLIWTSLGTDENTRWMGLNIILGADSLLLAFALLSKHKLVAPENRRQMWVSLILNLIALATINTSVLADLGFADKALLAWPPTLALALGLYIEYDAWRDYQDYVEPEESEQVW